MRSPAQERPRLACRLEGGRQGPPLLLVHGMLASGRQWQHNLEAMRRYTCPVAFDLWGHGESPTPDDPARYTVQALVDELEQTRARLGEERVVLCGHSFGAGIALHYAIAHPERTVAVIFSNSMSALSPPELFGSDAARCERAAAIERGGIDAIRALPIHPSRATRLDPAVRAELVADADAVDPVAVARLMAVTGPTLTVRDALDRIGCPMLLVNGTWEKAFQQLRDLAIARIPDLQVADVPAGHAVNIENPTAFNAAVAAFLERVLPPRL